MIHSMTGYGRGEFEHDGRKVSVEIKSVNHRYGDVTVKLPRFMIYLEDRIKKTVLSYVARGKIDVYINYASSYAGDVEIKLNESLAESYAAKLRLIAERYGLVCPDTLSLVAKFPDVITAEKAEEDEEVLWEILSPALTEALDRFAAMRAAEGEALKKDILDKREKLTGLLTEIEARAPLVAEDYRTKLTARLKVLLDETEIDQQRILAEATVFADKSCIDEEITRLKSHIAQLGAILDSKGPSGRKADFLVQEMNREANTIGSKSNDLTVTKAVLELKSEIEKIREQVQNIE